MLEAPMIEILRHVGRIGICSNQPEKLRDGSAILGLHTVLGLPCFGFLSKRRSQY